MTRNCIPPQKLPLPKPDFECAYHEWSAKTEWVQKRQDWPFIPLGMHRADVMKKYIEHLEAQVKVLREALQRIADNDDERWHWWYSDIAQEALDATKGVQNVSD